MGPEPQAPKVGSPQALTAQAAFLTSPYGGNSVGTDTWEQGSLGSTFVLAGTGDNTS